MSYLIHLARLEMRLSVFRKLLSLRCIKIKNLCAHHQEEVLRIPKHPQLAKFARNLADKTAKNKMAQTLLFKIKDQTNFGKL